MEGFEALTSHNGTFLFRSWKLPQIYASDISQGVIATSHAVIYVIDTGKPFD